MTLQESGRIVFATHKDAFRSGGEVGVHAMRENELKGREPQGFVEVISLNAIKIGWFDERNLVMPSTLEEAADIARLELARLDEIQALKEKARKESANLDSPQLPRSQDVFTYSI